MSHVQISWESERIDHKMITALQNVKLDILKMCLADIEYFEYEKPDAAKNGIRYRNHIVPGEYIGVPSNISIGATAMLMCSFGEFPIPPEILEYITEEYENGRVNEENLPQSEEAFEKGKFLVEAFLEKGIPYYAACAITGATWVECGWNVHVANAIEMNEGGVGGTSGWAGCGEGLFGLTFWSQKSKIIDKMMFPGLPKGMSSSDYETSNKHLCDCSEQEWVDILKEYLDMNVPKHKEILCREESPETDEERTLVLCSSYLFKAAGALDSNFDNVKETAERYMNTHINQAKTFLHQEDYHVYNGFASQIYVAIQLDKYLHGEDLDIDMSQPYDKFAAIKPSNNVRKSETQRKQNESLAQKLNSSVEYDNQKDVELDKQGTNTDIVLKVVRNKKITYKGDEAAYGKLFVNGKYWCDTAERRLVTPGVYDVAWRPEQGCTITGRQDWLTKGNSGNIMYKFASYSKGYVPLIKGVKGRSGIRIHEGKGVSWSEGCLVIGKLNEAGNELTNSWENWKSLYDFCHNCNSCKIQYVEAGYSAASNFLENLGKKINV